MSVEKSVADFVSERVRVSTRILYYGAISDFNSPWYLIYVLIFSVKSAIITFKAIEKKKHVLHFFINKNNFATQMPCSAACM